MKILAVETLRPDIQLNLLFVRLHTDDGLIGLGEAFFAARTVETYIHETATAMSLSQRLGGAVHHELRMYNTCAGAVCVPASPQQSSENWGVGHGSSPW